MSLHIREVCPDDAEAIVRIFNPIIAAGIYTVFDTPFSVQDERMYIENLQPRAVFQVAVRQEDQVIVGFQSMEPFATYTHAFDHVGVLGTYVDLDCRRQGIASQLFESTFQVAREKDYEKIFTFVREDNTSALTTYLKHGFSVVGTARRHTKINGAYVNEIIIERFLEA